MSKWDRVELAQRLHKCSGVDAVVGPEYEKAAEGLRAVMDCTKTDRAWWWEHAKVKPFVFSYGTDTSLFSRLIREASGLERLVYIFVTDDYSPPWPCFSSSFQKLTAEIEEAPFTEFIILDSEFNWAMVDNHHNQLMFFGHFEI